MSREVHEVVRMKRVTGKPCTWECPTCQRRHHRHSGQAPWCNGVRVIRDRVEAARVKVVRAARTR